MSTKIKGLMQAELKNRFDNMTECIVVSIRGISGTDNNNLRGDLAKDDIALTVVKNSLAARAFEEVGVAGMKPLLVGPSAICCGGDSIVDLVKAIEEHAKKLDDLIIKGGYLDGEVLDAEAAKALAKLPSRQELQGSIVMLACSPGSRLSSAVTSPASAIAGCLETIIDKFEGDEAA